MKRWTEHPSMPRCSLAHRSSVDLHLIAFAQNSIPFALEADSNLADSRLQTILADYKPTNASSEHATQRQHRAVAVRQVMNGILKWSRYGAERAEKEKQPRGSHQKGATFKQVENPVLNAADQSESFSGKFRSGPNQRQPRLKERMKRAAASSEGFKIKKSIAVQSN